MPRRLGAEGSRTLPLDRDDRTLLVSNSAFDVVTFEIWGALANGGRVVVPAVEELREPALLCRAVERYGITAGFFTVTLFERLVEAEPTCLAGMKHILVGGEAAPPRLFAEAAQHVPLTALMNGYGPTENTTFSCCFRLDRNPAELRSVPIGPPITGSGAVVVDESLQPVPVGVAGEILVCGAGLALGYLNDPELTRKRFRHLVDRLVGRTGDLGRHPPDGALEYLGRLDRQLKIRGFRVEPDDVEVALEQHPTVRRAAADAERITGTPTLRAAVEANGIDGLALRSWLVGRLPEPVLSFTMGKWSAFTAGMHASEFDWPAGQDGHRSGFYAGQPPRMVMRAVWSANPGSSDAANVHVYGIPRR